MILVKKSVHTHKSFEYAIFNNYKFCKICYLPYYHFWQLYHTCENIELQEIVTDAWNLELKETWADIWFNSFSLNT